MPLITACGDFSEAVGRHAVARACLVLLEAAATSIREHVPEDAGPALVRAIVVARARSVQEAVGAVRVWMACDPLTLIDSEPWDPLSSLLFLTECHLRVCVTHLFSTKGGWGALGEAPMYDVPLQRALHADEWRRTPIELEAGLEPRDVDSLLAASDIERASVALVVCVEGEGLVTEPPPTVTPRSPIPPDSDSDEDSIYDAPAAPVEPVVPAVAPPRLSRVGVRRLERAFLLANLRLAITTELAAYQEAGDSSTWDPFEHADAMHAWMRRTVEVDANNALLLRLDEWAVCCALAPGDVAEAGGECGGVPLEHRNAPSAWVLQKVKSDEDYRRIMAESKRTTEHAENVYVCFAGMLEQHFSFDWGYRCLVARINPAVALKKIREYVASANAKTPPLIVQREGGCATVISVHGRVECTTAARAISAWIALVAARMGGAYTRKANVADVIERIWRPPERPTHARPLEIGGASIALRGVLD